MVIYTRVVVKALVRPIEALIDRRFVVHKVGVRLIVDFWSWRAALSVSTYRPAYASNYHLDSCAF